MAGTPLTGNTVATTYNALLKVTDNSSISGSLKTITDGLGNDTAIQVSSAGVKSTGTLDVVGVVTLATALPLTGGGTGAATASTARTNLGLGDMAVQTASSVAITGGSVTGITDVTVADGGTGASTAANARTNLGVTATGADTTYVFRASNLSDLASASTARTNLGLGTAATQATGAFEVAGAAAAVTAASCQRASNLSDLASASTSRTNLGLGTASTQATGAFEAAGTALLKASNLSDLASAATARTNLGVFTSAINSDYAASLGINQAGAMNADLVFNTPGAPTVSLTAGTWLVVGAVTARTSDFDDEVWAQFYNNDDATVFGGGATRASSFQRDPISVSAIVTLSGTKTIYFKVFRTANVTLDVGSAAGPAGYISAQRLY